MSDIQAAVLVKVEELRHSFDRSFAEPVRSGGRTTIDFISIRLAGDIHAIRLGEIGGLFADVKITPCPSPVAALRGIAGFRGTLVPVYDLPALLGYPMSSARWLVLSASRDVALAFDDFDGHFRIEPEQIAASQGASAGRHVVEVARHAGGAWPIVNIPTVVAAIRAHPSIGSSHKEH